ncbi:nuclear transport factor 2 family protein [Amycolatopsis jiangsuensis]|uniref:nuclear transport factor 2 family protein n=1 Tax=Amycolatopsis jiangsuensis TaxID=1181879 RepID=UPI0028ADA21F|nr:nuclear transport factor 2 family protein [Amycolatopsis jiangsuensis]
MLNRARAVDEGNRSVFSDLLRDAVVVIRGRQVTGPAIGDLIAEGTQPTRHLVTNTRIVPVDDGTDVEAESYFTLLSTGGPPQMAAFGRYRDRLVRRGGRWSFVRHEVVVDQNT